MSFIFIIFDINFVINSIFNFFDIFWVALGLPFPIFFFHPGDLISDN